MAEKTDKKRISNLIGMLGGNIDMAAKRAAVMRPSATAVTTDERDRIINLVGRINAENRNSRGDGSLLNYLRSTTRMVADRRQENVQILQMAPEVMQAASIVIPSIMSPNDMRRGAISIVSTCDGLSEANNREIGEALTKYFNEELRYSANLPEWMREALYRSGAKAVMMVPVSELDRQFNAASHLRGGLEDYSDLIKLSEKSLFDFTNEDETAGKALSLSKASYETLSSGLESMIGDLVSAGHSEDDKSPKQSYHRPETAQLRHALESARSGFTNAAVLGLTDNPDVLKADKLIRRKTAKKVNERLGMHYKEAGFVSLRATVKDSDESHPLLMELPTEAVIPLHVPGDPRNHIGYFVAIDEFGNPIDSAQANAVPSLPDGMNQHFQELFRAYGISDFQPQVPAHYDTMNQIYQQIVTSYLNDKLDSIGLPNLSIGSDNAVYRAMLARYLHNRRTRLLFVPKEMMTYLAFNYNDNGTGRSKLEDIKFILSLRITLLVCQMMTSVNNAIDRKKLKVTFSGDFTGNILEHLEMVRNEAVHKATMAYSYDVNSVSRMLADRSYTVEANGIPGLDNYSVTSEQNERQTQPIDENAVNDIRRQLGLGLGVPPTALDAVSENEYSRSIATTNLFFSLTIMDLQDIVCAASSDFVRKYLCFSKPLQDEIRKILGGKAKKKAEQTEDKAIDDAISESDDSAGTASKLADEQIAEIIAGLKATLPAPTVAPDKAQFENLEAFVNSIDALINALFSDDLANGDQEMVEVLAAKRALAKSDAVREFMSTIGLMGISLPDLVKSSPLEMLNLRQHLIDFKAALTKQKEVHSAGGGADDAGGGMGGGGFGGRY